MRLGSALWLHASVFAYALRIGLRRFLVATALGTLLMATLPAVLSLRVHAIALGFGLLAPFLVLGRDAARRADGFREAVRVSRRAGRLVVTELLLPACAVVIVALLWTRGQPLPALTATAWGLAVLTAADALDRRALHPGAAWVVVAALVLTLYTAPWWLAPFMGQGLGHWVATLGFGLHPAAVALTAAGQTALQDPFFYTWTLSGTVDARPLSWTAGTGLYCALALVGAAWAVSSARRPTRSLA